MTISRSKTVCLCDALTLYGVTENTLAIDVYFPLESKSSQSHRGNVGRYLVHICHVLYVLLTALL